MKHGSFRNLHVCDQSEGLIYSGFLFTLNFLKIRTCMFLRLSFFKGLRPWTLYCIQRFPDVLIFLLDLCSGYGGPAGGGAGGDEDGGLEVNIPGIPGQDYPIYSEVAPLAYSTQR